MKKSPFHPDIAVVSHNKTWLTELLVNRLPKGVTVFESCRWEGSDLGLGTAKINVFMITPGSFDKSRMHECGEQIMQYPSKSIVLLSAEKERGSAFSYETTESLKSYFSQFNVPIFTSLNSCASFVKDKIK
jgi:hypothetical protein